MNQWWIEGLSPDLAAVASAVVNFSRFAQEGDRTALGELFDDDLVLIDHRPLGFGQLDKNGTIDTWMSSYQETPGFVMLQPTMDRLTANGFLCTSRIVYPMGFETGGVALMILRDGLFTNMEYFDPDDLDTALARFDDLTSNRSS